MTRAECSKRPAFSPAQPRRAKTRLFPNKAATNCHFIRGGWDDPNCARCSHPPTHWQIFFTRPALRLLCNRFPKTCHLPGRGPSDSPTSPEGVGRLFFTARIERPPLYRGGSASKKNGLPTPSHPSEAARCASKGIVPATPSPFFSILLCDDVAHKIIHSCIGDLDLDEFPCRSRPIVDIHDAVDLRSQPFVATFKQ